MSKEVKRYEAMLLEDSPRLQNILPQGAILCGKEPVEVYLASDYDALLAERDAILLQAQTWAGEAKTQKATVDEVGKILGGVPDWAPIAAGVEELKKDAERYRWLRRAGYADIRDVPAMAPARMDEFIDAALQGEQP